MKQTLLIFFLCGASMLVSAQRPTQQGTIVRMRMGECLSTSGGLRAALSGSARTATEELCPEYVLLSEKVVYIIVGKNPKALAPLAEFIKFRLTKNELLIRVDDEDHEMRFVIREMVLRSEWNKVHQPLVTDKPDTATQCAGPDAGIAMNTKH